MTLIFSPGIDYLLRAITVFILLNIVSSLIIFFCLIFFDVIVISLAISSRFAITDDSWLFLDIFIRYYDSRRFANSLAIFAIIIY